VSESEQSARDGRAHPAGAGDSDPQAFLPLCP
jgi:hypothetical protein